MDNVSNDDINGYLREILSEMSSGYVRAKAHMGIKPDIAATLDELDKINANVNRFAMVVLQAKLDLQDRFVMAPDLVAKMNAATEEITDLFKETQLCATVMAAGEDAPPSVIRERFNN